MRPSLYQLALVATAVTIASLAACHRDTVQASSGTDTRGTEAPNDTFDLASVGSSRLPVRYRSVVWQWECPIQVDSGYLIVGNDSTVEHHAYGVSACPGGKSTNRDVVFRGGYHVRSDSIEINYIDDGSEIRMTTGVARGDTIAIQDSSLSTSYVRRKNGTR